ncbi:MAG: hypothetical protein MI810_00420 [Flavobacteriales bacterium]|nr:hypothetical protein [Flavobacteriales bacterium]
MIPKNTFLLIALPLLLGACSTENTPAEETNKNDSNSPSNAELEMEDAHEEEVLFNPDLFPTLGGEVLSFESKMYHSAEDIPYSTLETSMADLLFKNSEYEQVETTYIIGQLRLTKNLGLFVVGLEHLYGWLEIHARVYDYTRHQFVNDFELIAAQDGDAGELLSIKSWFDDLNEDGLPELLRLSGNTFLDIDDPEEERTTNFSVLDIYEFDVDEASYIISTDSTLNQSLDSNYTITLDEFLD